jgi:hypothetical protein
LYYAFSEDLTPHPQIEFTRLAEKQGPRLPGAKLSKAAASLPLGVENFARAVRQQTVQPVFGIIKSVMGFRQFLLRGLEKVGLKWQWVRIACNLKRPHTVGAGLKRAGRG